MEGIKSAKSKGAAVCFMYRILSFIYCQSREQKNP